MDDVALRTPHQLVPLVLASQLFLLLLNFLHLSSNFRSDRSHFEQETLDSGVRYGERRGLNLCQRLALTAQITARVPK